MIAWRTAGLAVVCLVSAPGTGWAQEDLEALGWMSGCWLAEDRGSRSEEIWSRAESGLLLGMSRTVSASGTVAFEYLRIESDSVGATLYASPGGRSTTAFPAVAMSQDRFRVERPDHDFPRAIEYRAVGSDSLVARVFGEVDAARPAFVLRFGRTACPGGGG